MRPTTRLALLVFGFCAIVAGLCLIQGVGPQPSAATEPTSLYHCVTIRDRKVCNIDANMDASTHEDEWVGRFAACAPEIPSTAVPLTDNGYTVRVIVWCAPR